MNAERRFPIEEMDRTAVDFSGRVGFYIKDLAGGSSHEYDADRRFPAASICKVPILMELFRQVEEGRLSLDARRQLGEGISTHGSGVLKLLEDRPELTLCDYCRLMIGVSDNMATDLLLEAVGLEAVNSTLDALGFARTRVNMSMGRWHYLMVGMAEEPCTRGNDELMLEKVRTDGIDYDRLPFQDAPENNVTTAREMGEMLEQLCEGRIVSPQASADMVEMLKRCQDRGMIPRDVAPEVSIAHKHGSSSRIRGDVGIVFLPTGPLIISALTLAGSDSGQGREAIARISRLAVEALSPESRR